MSLDRPTTDTRGKVGRRASKAQVVALVEMPQRWQECKVNEASVRLLDRNSAEEESCTFLYLKRRLQNLRLMHVVCGEMCA